VEGNRCQSADNTDITQTSSSVIDSLRIGSHACANVMQSLPRSRPPDFPWPVSSIERNTCRCIDYGIKIKRMTHSGYYSSHAPWREECAIQRLMRRVAMQIAPYVKPKRNLAPSRAFVLPRLQTSFAANGRDLRPPSLRHLQIRLARNACLLLFKLRIIARTRMAGCASRGRK